MNILTEELEAKRLGLLHELVPPPPRSIVHLVNPNYPSTVSPTSGRVAAAARVKGACKSSLSDGQHRKRNRHKLLRQWCKQGAGALLVGADPFFNSQRAQIVALAARHSPSGDL